MKVFSSLREHHWLVWIWGRKGGLQGRKLARHVLVQLVTLRSDKTLCFPLLFDHLVQFLLLFLQLLIVLDDTVDIVRLFRRAIQNVQLVRRKMGKRLHKVAPLRGCLPHDSFLVGDHRRHALRFKDVLDDLLPVLEPINSNLCVIH